MVIQSQFAEKRSEYVISVVSTGLNELHRLKTTLTYYKSFYIYLNACKITPRRTGNIDKITGRVLLYILRRVNSPEVK